MAIIAILAGIIGIIGSIVPGLPGPPVSWVGMLMAFLAKGLDKAGEPLTLTALLIWLVIVIVVSVLDYVIPAKFTKLTGGSKAASWGAIIGLFAGCFIPPVGMILGSLAGAFLAEYFVAEKGVSDSIKSSLGAFLGFICGTGIKLITSAVMMYFIIVFAF